jgi:hypothetical protein
MAFHVPANNLCSITLTSFFACVSQTRSSITQFRAHRLPSFLVFKANCQETLARALGGML